MTAIAPGLAEQARLLADRAGFEIDPGLLAQLVTAHPALAAEADEWGWGDTALREQLADVLAVTLLRRVWPIHGDQHAGSFFTDLRRAHDAWIAANRAS